MPKSKSNRKTEATSVEAATNGLISANRDGSTTPLNRTATAFPTIRIAAEAWQLLNTSLSTTVTSPANAQIGVLIGMSHRVRPPNTLRIVYALPCPDASQALLDDLNDGITAAKKVPRKLVEHAVQCLRHLTGGLCIVGFYIREEFLRSQRTDPHITEAKDCQPNMDEAALKEWDLCKFPYTLLEDRPSIQPLLVAVNSVGGAAPMFYWRDNSTTDLLLASYAVEKDNEYEEQPINAQLHSYMDIVLVFPLESRDSWAELLKRHCRTAMQHVEQMHYGWLASNTQQQWTAIRSIKGGSSSEMPLLDNVTSAESGTKVLLHTFSPRFEPLILTDDGTLNADESAAKFISMSIQQNFLSVAYAHAKVPAKHLLHEVASDLGSSLYYRLVDCLEASDLQSDVSQSNKSSEMTLRKRVHFKVPNCHPLTICTYVKPNEASLPFSLQQEHSLSETKLAIHLLEESNNSKMKSCIGEVQPLYPTKGRFDIRMIVLVAAVALAFYFIIRLQFLTVVEDIEL